MNKSSRLKLNYPLNGLFGKSWKNRSTLYRKSKSLSNNTPNTAKCSVNSLADKSKILTWNPHVKSLPRPNWSPMTLLLTCRRYSSCGCNVLRRIFRGSRRIWSPWRTRSSRSGSMRIRRFIYSKSIFSCMIICRKISIRLCGKRSFIIWKLLRFIWKNACLLRSLLSMFFSKWTDLTWRRL